MASIKPFLKHLFYLTNTTTTFDRLVFLSAYVKNFRRNWLFRRENRAVPLPPAYYLYETYTLDYRQYISDGQVTAKELLHEIKDLFPQGPTKILDWGCGVSRIVRHLPSLVPDANIHAADINLNMIQWNSENITGVSFKHITDPCRLNYPDAMFDLIYAHSVFTHIHTEEQLCWIKEIFRILMPGGIFVFSTHGSRYFDKMLPFERNHLLRDGSYTKSIRKKGHRLMTSYNVAAVFRKEIQPWFEVIRFYDGTEHPEKSGGQDLWVARKGTGQK